MWTELRFQRMWCHGLLFSCCDKTATQGGKGLFHLVALRPLSSSEGSQGRNLFKQRLWRKCAHRLASSGFLGYVLRTTCSDVVLLTVGLTRSCQSSVKPTGQSDGGNSFTEVPSSQMTLVYVKLTKTNHHMWLAGLSPIKKHLFNPDRKATIEERKGLGPHPAQRTYKFTVVSNRGIEDSEQPYCLQVP